MYRIESIKVISLVFLCVAVIFPLTGCGNKASEETALKVAEEGKDADVTINKDGDSVSMTVTEEGNQQTTMQLNISDGDTTAVITGEDGNMTVASGASAGVPEGFPKDVPVHPSLKVNTSLTDGTTSFTLNASSTEKFDDLVAYYKEESIKQGWKEQMSMQQNMETPMHMFAYEKDKRMMNIVIQQDSETINITTNVTGE